MLGPLTGGARDLKLGLLVARPSKIKLCYAEVYAKALVNAPFLIHKCQVAIAFFSQMHKSESLSVMYIY